VKNEAWDMWQLVMTEISTGKNVLAKNHSTFRENL
jgi:hypothetical protein